MSLGTKAIVQRTLDYPYTILLFSRFLLHKLFTGSSDSARMGSMWQLRRRIGDLDVREVVLSYGIESE